MTIEAAIENAVQQTLQQMLAPLLADLKQSIKPRAEELLLTREQVASMFNISVRTLDEVMLEKGFPQPLQLAPKSFRWRESELIRWIDQQSFIARRNA